MPEPLNVFDVVEYLFTNRVANLPPEALADVFDSLIWCFADNGYELLRVRDGWLRCDDRDRVAIALAMGATFPFNGGDAMEVELRRIELRWPQFADRCAELRTNWKDAQRGRR